MVSGTLTDSEIVVAADGADVHLVLNGASITNADGPAIDVRDAGSAGYLDPDPRAIGRIVRQCQPGPGGSSLLGGGYLP